MVTTTTLVQTRMLAFCYRHWFLIALCAVLVFAGFVPGLAAPSGPLHPAITVHLAVAAAFFISGLTLPTAQLRSAAGHWRLHVFVQLFCFVLAPVVMLLTVKIATSLGLPDALGDGLIILGCLPTTIASCVIYTRTAHGNEAGALCNAVGGNVFGLFITPLLVVFFLGTHGDTPILAVLQQLSLEVILPIIVGQIIRACTRGHEFRYLRHLPSLFLLYIILCVFSATFVTGIDPQLLQAVIWTTIIAIILHFIFLSLCWWFAQWSWWQFTHKDRIAALFCATQKTLALGVPLVSILYAGHPQLALLTLPLIIYHPLQLLIGGLLVSRFNNQRAPADLGK